MSGAKDLDLGLQILFDFYAQLFQEALFLPGRGVWAPGDMGAVLTCLLLERPGGHRSAPLLLFGSRYHSCTFQ